MILKKLLASIVCFSLGIISSETYAANSDKKVIRIVETTDVHGNFYSYDFLNGKPLDGGLSRVCTYINMMRDKYGENNVALLDAGDVLQGQPCVYYANFIDTTSIHLSSSMIDYMRYDAVAFGNHDIEAGHKVYDKWVKDCHCPMLGANVINTDNGKPYLKPYVIINKGGVKIAILGLLTPAVPMWLPHNLWSGLQFEDIVPAAKKWAEYIENNEKPDLLVGLFHTGLKGGGNNNYNENAAEKIALNVPGFDVIFYGHDHQRYCKQATNKLTGKSVWLLNAGASANNIAQANITIEENCGKKNISNIEGNIESMAGYEPNTAFMERYSKEFNNVKDFVSERVGTLDEPINTFDYFFGPSTMATLLHDVQLSKTKADVSFVTPLTFNEIINAGPVCVSDIFKLYRYENRINIFQLTGKEICGALEKAYDLWTNTMKSENDHALNISNETQRGARLNEPSFLFMSAAGIDYTVDVTKPNGKKISIQRMSDGTPFDKTKTYRVAVNSYIGSGGGGLLTEGSGINMSELPKRIVWTSEKDLRHYMIEYFQEHHEGIKLKAGSNWRFTPAKWTEKALERDRHILSQKNNSIKKYKNTNNQL